jgi:2-methylcitrate dehydratase PrpD
MSTKDFTRVFCEFAEKTTYGDLPKAVVEQTKDYILDSIGCALASYSVPEGVLIAKMGKEFGSGNDGTVLPTGQKTSAVAASYVNCKLCNFIDFDETLYNYYHIGGVPLFSALHAAEKVGANGKALINAVALGYEFAYRFCKSYALLTINDKGGTDIAKSSGFGFNSIAGAVAAAKVLGLNGEGIQNAMGIAGYYVPVPLISKWLYTKPLGVQKYQDMGWFAFTGLLAALFTKDGYDGDQHIVDDYGEYSFWKAFGMLQFDFNGMNEGLGKDWGIMEMGIKTYPCCRWFHTPIYMLKTIMKKQSLKADDIKAITVKLHPAVAKSELFQSLSKWDEWPIKDAVHSQFSAGYCLACAAYDVPVGPQWQLPETLTNQELAWFSKKVNSVMDEKCEQKMVSYLKSDQPKGKLMSQVHYSLEVSSSKGTFTDVGEYIYGDTYDPKHRLSRQELKEKFVRNSSPVLQRKTLEKVIEAIYEIDGYSSIKDFTVLFQ